MKRMIKLVVTGLCTTALISCNDETVATKKEKEVIVVPEKKKEEPKPTSVTVDKNGVEVESKKVNVKVNPNGE